MKASSLIEKDIQKLNESAHWNAEQQKVFDMLIHRDYGIRFGDVFIYAELGMSESKYYTIKREIKKKIARIITDS